MNAEQARKYAYWWGGMGVQTLVTSIFLALHLIEVTPVQQLACSSFFFFGASIFIYRAKYLEERNKNGGSDHDAYYP